MIFIVKCDAAFVEEIDTKNDVVTKIHGINDSRVFINNSVLNEFREPDFFQEPLVPWM